MLKTRARPGNLDRITGSNPEDHNAERVAAVHAALHAAHHQLLRRLDLGPRLELEFPRIEHLDLVTESQLPIEKGWISRSL